MKEKITRKVIEHGAKLAGALLVIVLKDLLEKKLVHKGSR